MPGMAEPTPRMKGCYWAVLLLLFDFDMLIMLTCDRFVGVALIV
jgi:hypothetical protein